MPYFTLKRRRGTWGRGKHQRMKQHFLGKKEERYEPWRCEEVGVCVLLFFFVVEDRWSQSWEKPVRTPCMEDSSIHFDRCLPNSSTPLCSVVVGTKRWVGQEWWSASHSWGISIWVESQKPGGDVGRNRCQGWCRYVRKTKCLYKKCPRTGIPRCADNNVHAPIEQLMYHQFSVAPHLSFCPFHCIKGKVPALAHLSHYFLNTC